MAHGLRKIGIALIVALGIGAAAANVAAAKTFTSEAEKTVLTGNQAGFQEVWGFIHRINCPTATLTGSSWGKEVTSLTLHPRFGEKERCKYEEGPTEVSVETAGCDFVIGSETSFEEHGSFAIQCEASKFIRFEMPNGCIFEIHPQTAEKGVHYLNTESGGTLEWDAQVTVTNLLFLAKSFLCSTYGYTTGEHLVNYTAFYTVKGYEGFGEEPPWEEGEPVGVWVE